MLRLSLVALTESAEDDQRRLGHLHRLMQRSSVPEANVWADYVLFRGRQRLTGDSLDKRYINLIGGPRASPQLAALLAELHAAGFGPWLDIVQGPLMRATHGEMPFCHMPIVPGSTYPILRPAFVEAYHLSNASSPDPELDLQGFDHALWGPHSLRRFADTVARETMHLSDATEQDIDLLFGWQESRYTQKMQLHYDSRFTRTRCSRVTEFA